MATYLYAITGAARPGGELGRGVGYDPAPLRIVRHGDVAALVSDIFDNEQESEGRALRRDLTAHEQVVRRAMEFATILPVSFGTIFEDDRQLVDELLEPSGPELAALLDEFEGLVELSVKADFIEDAIIARVLDRDLELRAWRDSAKFGGTDDQLAFGEALARAVEDEAAAVADRLVQQLRGLALDVRLAGRGSGTAILKGSFLVEEGRVPEFDSAVERLVAQTRGVMEFDYLGPLPPYSFVHINLGAPVE